LPQMLSSDVSQLSANGRHMQAPMSMDMSVQQTMNPRMTLAKEPTVKSVYPKAVAW